MKQGKLSTMVSQYLSIRSRTMTSAETYEYQMNFSSDKWWNIFFLVKMQQVQGLMSSEADEYWGMAVDNV